MNADTFPYIELNEQEVEVIADLHKAKCKISEISRLVKHKFDKAVSNQKICKLIRKMSPTDDDDCNTLQKFLKNIEEDRGIADYPFCVVVRNTSPFSQIILHNNSN